MNFTRYSATLIPLLFVFLWSTGFIGAKYGLPYAEPATFLFVRMLLVASILLLASLFIDFRWPHRPVDYVHSALVGILIHGVYLGGVFFAISRGLDAGISALIVSLQPLATVLLAAAYLHEPLTARKIIGIALGLFGVAIVILSRGIGTHGFVLIGLVSCTFSLLGISIGTIYQKKFCTDIELLPGVCIQCLANALFLLPIAVWFESMVIDWQPQFIFAMLWLVFVLSLGAVMLLMWLIKRGGAGNVASLFYLVPPFAAVEAWLLFGESLSLMAILGIALSVVGVAIVIRQK